jgi:hypothetical protein
MVSTEDDPSQTFRDLAEHGVAIKSESKGFHSQAILIRSAQRADFKCHDCAAYQI